MNIVYKDDEIAGLFSRVIAKAVDVLLVMTAAKVIPEIGFYLGALYLLIGDGFFEGRSLGKRLLGLQVKSLNEGSSPVKDSVLRNSTIAFGFILLKIPLIGWLFFILIYFLEFVIMLGNSENMRIGDEIAKTVVLEVKEKTEG